MLFIIATVASIASFIFLGSLSEPDYLTRVAEDESQLLGGVFVEFIWVLAVLGIPVFLYSILRKHSHASAVGFYSFRFIEAFLAILYSLSLLLLISLSQEYVEAGAPDTSFHQTAGNLLLAARDWAFLIGPGLAFTLSALILNSHCGKRDLSPDGCQLGLSRSRANARIFLGPVLRLCFTGFIVFPYRRARDGFCSLADLQGIRSHSDRFAVYPTESNGIKQNGAIAPCFD